MKNLFIIPELCIGCHRCELICSFAHFKVFNTARARIWVIREKYTDAVIFCNQCGLCIDACPLKIINRNVKTGAVEIDEEKCTGCGQCVTACPYGAVTIDPIRNVALKCDLCGGEPKCVNQCPEKCLIYADVTKVAHYKRLLFSKLQKKEPVPSV
ncbi:MAG: hypothetical protein APU95_03610 [Hadesarchaea archaeon YNP_N21]|nr:MAG: hypothetical protein APU95_03610 [Hadesarchaea archaeon YNP_N21]